jgi:nucleoside-diphosphate-sugar epimerase
VVTGDLNTAGGLARVAVTGGAGVLGGALARRLAAEGAQVTSIDVGPWPDAPEGVRHAVADIRDTGALIRLMAGAEAVVHCAGALPSYPAEQIRSVIVDGTRSVLQAACQSAVPRVVYISSTAVYGLPDVVPTPESYGPHPIDAYGAAKAAAEEVCRRYRDLGLCVPILRPKTFLGPGRMGLFAMLFEWAEEGHNFPVLGSGDARIQMFAIEDLLDAVRTALTAPRELADDAFNVAAAQFGTLREDFQAVLDAAGHGKRVVRVPAAPASAMLRVLELAHLSPVYGRLRLKLLADSYVSIEHARERLGFAPRYSNRDAILRTYEWWRRDRAASQVAASTAAAHDDTAPGGTAPDQTAPDKTARSGRTSREAWRQGALRTAKVFF